MQFLKRLFGRGKSKARRPTSERPQTDAEEKSAQKYWKGEVSADKERRGTPDKHPK